MRCTMDEHNYAGLTVALFVPFFVTTPMLREIYTLL